MGKLTSGRVNRFFSVGLLAAAVVMAEGAHAAKTKSCEDIFGNKNTVSTEPTIPVPSTKRSVRTPAETAALPAAKSSQRMLPVSTEGKGHFTPPFAFSLDLKSDIRMLASLKKIDSTPEPIAKLLSERRRLTDFLLEDDAENLAVRSPFTVMNAGQRVLSMIYAEGARKIRLQMTGEEVTDYKFFSTGPEVTNGKRIVDAVKPTSEFVRNVKAQARKVRTGSSVPLLVGSGGTGKSEFLELLATAMEKKTSSSDPTFASYTFTWVNLEDIGSLHPFLISFTKDDRTAFQDIEAPLGDSPFVLFPKEVQKVIVEKAAKSVGKITEGMKPRPFEPADPLSAVLRQHVIEHYAKLVGHDLNPLEIVQALDRHIVVRRQIIGPSYGRLPLIDASGNDIDVAGLFMSMNPQNRFGAAGPSSPFSWNYSGKILNGHGNVVQFDELLRNPKELIDMLLGAFESRRLSVNGAPTVPFDALIVAATNTENLIEFANSGTGAAGIDRYGITPMRWSLFPNRIGELALVMNMKELYQQDLTVEDAPIVRGDINDLFPLVQGSDQIITPDHRRRVFLGEGPDRVEVAPYTLLLMAEIATATRLHTDETKAQRAIGNAQILGNTIFRNPVDRIRLLEGRLAATAEEIRELSEISELLKEGESGISARDVARWLESAAEDARATTRTLTPGILLNTLRRKLTDGSVKSPSMKKRLEWLDLVEEIKLHLLLPRLERDVLTALANGDHAVKTAYAEIIEEMMAQYRHPGATSYQSTVSKTEKTINVPRMEAVKQIYNDRNGRALSLTEIAVFHQGQGLVGNVIAVPNEELLSAIQEYYANINFQASGLSSIIEYGNTGYGDDDVKMSHQALVGAMKSMGYNEVSIRDTLTMIQKMRNESQAPRRR